jgi:hypothetical protein
MVAEISVPKFTEEDYLEINGAVAYMEESIAKKGVGTEPGCPNEADEITDEAFEDAALFLAAPFNAAIARIHGSH